MMKAIETTATIDKKHRLVLDEYLEIPASAKVKVIILINDQNDIPEGLWLKAAATNSVFDDLSDPSEDIYSNKDGKVFHS